MCFTHMYVCSYIHACIYMYIQREKERERERQKEGVLLRVWSLVLWFTSTHCSQPMTMAAVVKCAMMCSIYMYEHVYIYVYTCIYIERGIYKCMHDEYAYRERERYRERESERESIISCVWSLVLWIMSTITAFVKCTTMRFTYTHKHI